MPEVVRSVPCSLGEAVSLLASADRKLEKADSLGHKKLFTVCSMLRDVISFYQSTTTTGEHAHTIVQREIIHHYHNARPAGSSAAGATALQSYDDLSTEDIGTFGSSDDCVADGSQDPPGYWDESDFDDGNDESQDPPGYWDESDFSAEEYFSESAVSLPHLGVSQSDYYGNANGDYTTAEWEAWDASQDVHDDHADHQLYQGGPDFPDVSAVGVHTDFADYDDGYCDYGASDSGGAYGYDDGGYYY
ncbi:hypothetical protein CYMTET_49900 [Cymbomonas tetramitiformis]|uniref:Uncharacterized protein n=1 Tax=Cymbomonas tetramitiformis TaxID=36881 RepID=A0AAE0EU36_9CHLO|nr:hypothetical protein CYMTET_49900 [Cymbomonas tetramitiformis]